MRRHWKVICASAGAVLVVASLLLAFVIAPMLSKLPSDTNTTRNYTGTAPVLVNPAALASGQGTLVARNVPVQLAHIDKVVQSNSSAAAVRDTRTVTVAGTMVNSLPNTYVVDRKNLGPSTALTYAGATKQVGLTFNFPIGTDKHNYTGWVPDTMTTTTLHYTGTATRDGVSTYVFTSSVPPTPIKEPAQLARLPKTLPKGSLAGLATKLGLPAAQQSQLAQAIGKLPASIPLGYVFSSTSKFWVEPNTGIIVDQASSDTRTAVIPSAVLGTSIPLAPVSVMNYAYTSASVKAATDDATSKTDTMTLLDTTLPIVVGVVGGLLLAAAAVGFWRGRRPPTGVTPSAPVTPAEPVGGRPGR